MWCQSFLVSLPCPIYFPHELSRKQLRRSLQRICSLENGSKYDIYPNKAWFQLNNWSPRSLKVRLGYLRETSKQSVFPFFTPPKNNMEPQKLGDLEDDVHVQSKGWWLGSMLVFQGITCKTRELKLHTKPGSQIVSNNARHCHVWPKDPAMMAKQRAENKLTFGKCQLGWPFYHYCGHLFKGSFKYIFSRWGFQRHLKYMLIKLDSISPKIKVKIKKQLNTFGTIENWWLEEISLKIDGWKMNFAFKMVPFQVFFV